MKLASFHLGDRPSWGIVDGSSILDMGAVLGDRYPTLRAALAAEALPEVAAAMGRASRLPLDAVAFAPVIPDAEKILCVGHNYESHRQETGRDRTSHPSLFTRFADTQVGHKQPLRRPGVSTMFDYEGELAVIIGRAGRSISEERALEHVAGYSCYMDASVRDWQWHTQQFTPGKNFPATGGFGPWMVTRDEVPDPAALHVTTRLNGAVMQSQPTAEMIFSVPAIIAYISTFTPLSPGDVIVTGTPGGVGAKRQPPVWMTAGDRVEVDIPHIGVLSHDVLDDASNQ